MTWQYRDRSGTFTADDFIVGQFDIYLSPAIYQEIFEFEFRVDLGLLSVRLFTSERVPILVRQERQRLRARIQSQNQQPRNLPAADRTTAQTVQRRLPGLQPETPTPRTSKITRQPAPSPAALKSSTAMCRAV